MPLENSNRTLQMRLPWFNLRKSLGSNSEVWITGIISYYMIITQSTDLRRYTSLLTLLSSLVIEKCLALSWRTSSVKMTNISCWLKVLIMSWKRSYLKITMLRRWNSMKIKTGSIQVWGWELFTLLVEILQKMTIKPGKTNTKRLELTQRTSKERLKRLTAILKVI